MRITGGLLRGMELAVPRTGAIRPTQESVREALFATLAPELPGCIFADLFSGSGAAGLEALSRGASRAIFVERDARHAQTLEKNISAAVARGLDPSAAGVVRCDAFRWAAGPERGVPASIVFADPPYNGADEACTRLMASLAASGRLRRGGLFAAESAAARPCGKCKKEEETPPWDLLRDRRYGNSRIRIWRLAAPA